MVLETIMVFSLHLWTEMIYSNLRLSLKRKVSFKAIGLKLPIASRMILNLETKTYRGQLKLIEHRLSIRRKTMMTAICLTRKRKRR